jgi:hypothetical protein
MARTYRKLDRDSAADPTERVEWFKPVQLVDDPVYPIWTVVYGSYRQSRQSIKFNDAAAAARHGEQLLGRPIR